MKTTEYIPKLSRGTRVRFLGRDTHPQNGKFGRIIDPVPNPSKRPENQWYDVGFDNHSLGRFNERYLLKVEAAGEGETAA